MILFIGIKRGSLRQMTIYGLMLIGGYVGAMILVIQANLLFRNLVLRIVVYISAWIVGLMIHHKVGMIEADRLMRNASPEEIQTEEFLTSIPDGPNITVTWVFTGWIALVLGHYISKALLRRRANQLSPDDRDQ